MLIELITPLIIASAPMAITVQEGQYSHITQSSPIDTSTQWTSGGTRTYDMGGRPNDSDND